MSSWVECFVSIRFNLSVGPKIEHITPTNALTKRGIDRIIQNAFPDSNNNYGHDFIFFFTMPDDTLAGEHALLEAISSTTGTARNTTKLYGATYYRQKYDVHVPRSCVQQAVVLLSRLPYLAIHELLLRTVAIEFNASCALSPDSQALPIASAFAPMPLLVQADGFSAEHNGSYKNNNHIVSEPITTSVQNRYYSSQFDVLDSAVKELANWPTPHPRTRYRLPFMHRCLSFVTPSAAQRPAQSTLVMHPRAKLSNTIIPLNTREGNYDDKVFDPLPLYSLLGDHAHYLTYLWELIITHEPLLVIGSTANVASACAYALASLILPIEYNGVLRPYFTVQSEEIGRFSRMGEALPFNPREGIILAATNPFLMRQFNGWHNLLVVTDHAVHHDKLMTLSSYTKPMKEVPEQLHKRSQTYSYNQAASANYNDKCVNNQELPEHDMANHNHTVEKDVYNKHFDSPLMCDAHHDSVYSPLHANQVNTNKLPNQEQEPNNESQQYIQEKFTLGKETVVHFPTSSTPTLNLTSVNKNISHNSEQLQQEHKQCSYLEESLENKIINSNNNFNDVEEEKEEDRATNHAYISHTMNLLRHVRSTSELTTPSSTIGSPFDMIDNCFMEVGQTPLTVFPMHFSTSSLSSSFASCNSSRAIHPYASQNQSKDHDVNFIANVASPNFPEVNKVYHISHRNSYNNNNNNNNTNNNNTNNNNNNNSNTLNDNKCVTHSLEHLKQIGKESNEHNHHCQQEERSEEECYTESHRYCEQQQEEEQQEQEELKEECMQEMSSSSEERYKVVETTSVINNAYEKTTTTTIAAAALPSLSLSLEKIQNENNHFAPLETHSLILTNETQMSCESPIAAFTRAHYHAALASATIAPPVGCSSPRTKHKIHCRNRLQHNLHNYFESNHLFYLNHSEQKEILLKRLDAVSKLEPSVQQTSVLLTLSRWWGGDVDEDVVNSKCKCATTTTTTITTTTVTPKSTNISYNDTSATHSCNQLHDITCQETKLLQELSSLPSSSSSPTAFSSRICEKEKSNINKSEQLEQEQQMETISAFALFSQYNVADDIVRKFFTSLTMEFLTPITAWFTQVVEHSVSCLRLCDATALETTLSSENFLQFFKLHHRQLAPLMWKKHQRYKTYKIVYERFARGVLFTSVMNMLLMHHLRKELEQFQVDEWILQFPVQAERIDLFISLYKVLQHELQAAPDPDINFVRNAASVLAAMAATVDVTLREEFMIKASELQLEREVQ